MVRRLHLDELGPGAGIAEDDWYETERLTGHITGRARSSPGLEQRLQDAPAVVLDWRHAAATPPSTVLGEWRRAVASRRGRWQPPRFPLRAAKLRTWWEHRRSGAVDSAHSTASITAAQAAQQPVGGQVGGAAAAIPRLEFRHAAEPIARDTPRSLHRAIAAKRLVWRWGGGAIAAALAIAGAAVGTTWIVSAVGGGAAKPGHAGLVTGAPLRSSAFAPTAAALMQALSGVAHDVRGSSSASYRVSTRAPRRGASRHSSHPARARSPAGARSSAAHTTAAAPAAPTQSYTPVAASSQSSAGYRQSSTSAAAPQHSAPSSSSSSSTSPSKAALRSLITGPGRCSC